MEKKVLSTVVGAALLAAASTASAYEAGDIIVRAGAASVQPDDSMTGTLNTLQATVDNNTQLGITAAYMLTDNIGIELLAATPFEHTITTTAGTVDTKHLPPTLSLQYFPLDNSSALQPYVGAGINYTTFFQEDSALGDVKLEDSFGLALQVGVDYKINDNMVLNAAVWNIDIETDAKLNGADIGTATLDPWVYMIGLGYKF